MTFRRIPIPKRLSPRLWLLTLPTALISFERRQHIPKLPIGAARYLGVPIAAAGLALVAGAWRKPGISIAAKGPIAPLASKPATAGGILVVAGVGLLLRSAVITAYSLVLAVVSSTESIDVEEPAIDTLAGDLS